jgi:hypothetical protein
LRAFICIVYQDLNRPLMLLTERLCEIAGRVHVAHRRCLRSFQETIGHAAHRRDDRYH